MREIAEALKKELFSDYTNCGPQRGHKEYHRKVTKPATIYSVGEPPYIVPDNFYHPEIKVVVDFTHQFTVSTSEDDIQGRRPVDPDVLKGAVAKLKNFFSYYFDYVRTYGKEEIKYYLKSLENMNDELNILCFLNSIFNSFLTHISVERSRTSIGTATVVFKDNPNYKSGENSKAITSNIFLEKTLDILNQLFVPMLPITIWGRGRLYKNWYFPIFDGYIMHMTPSTSQGFTEITLSCKDTLELARISQEMVNPAIIQIEEFRKQTAINIFSQPLYGLDHMTIFNMMFHGGSVIFNPNSTGGELVNADDSRLVKLFDIPGAKSQYLNFSALGDFGQIDPDTYLTPETCSDYRSFLSRDEFNIKNLVLFTSHKERKRCTINWGNSYTPYRIFNTKAPNVFTSEFSSRLDVIRDIAGMVYYELYVDGAGNIKYHPMRLANDFIDRDIIYGNVSHQMPFPGAQVVGAEEIINQNSMLNIDELTTFLRLFGVFPTLPGAQQELLELVGSGINKPYMERFGYRRKEVKNPLFNYNPEYRTTNGEKVKFLDLAAESLIRYMNSELFSKTATMIFRPEMEVALPIYFPNESNMFYLQSMSHSVTIGGEATTTINSNFGRKDYQNPPDLFNFLLASERMYKTGGSFITYEGDTGFVEVHQKAESDYAIDIANWTQNALKEQNALDQVAATLGAKATDTDSKKAARDASAQETSVSTQGTREEAARKKEIDKLANEGLS